jgi:hypothetical protein
MGNEENIESLILALLQRALIDIRMFSREENIRSCENLSDLFHNVPLQLRKIRKEGGDYQEVLDWISMRAEQKNMTNWLRIAIAEINQ